MKATIPGATALCVSFLLLLSSQGAAPPTVEGPSVRWAAGAQADEQLFEGDRFVALPAVPDTSRCVFTVAAWVRASDLAAGNATYGRGVARSNRNEQIGDWVLSVHRDGRVRF